MRRFAYVDVLRGVAILVVFAHHLPPGLEHVLGRVGLMGGRGVDLFFVLSGFLIGSTSLSRAATGATPATQAKAYWLLRTLRIWPVYFLLLAVYVATPRTFDPLVGQIVRDHPIPYLTFTSNSLGQPTLELGILWSLAIEEQFYLAVGVAVLATARTRETLAAAFIAMAGAAIAVALRTRYDLHALYAANLLPQGHYVFRLYHSTLARIDQLGFGILAAVVAPRFNAAAWAQRRAGARASTWGVIVVTVLILVLTPQHPVLEFFGLGLVFAAAVLWAQRPATRFAEALTIEKPVLALLANAGKLSFGLYMFHPFTRHWTLALFRRTGFTAGPWTAPALLAVWIPVTWALAALSYRFLEEPLLAWARERAAAMLRASSPPPAGSGIRVPIEKSA